MEIRFSAEIGILQQASAEIFVNDNQVTGRSMGAQTDTVTLPYRFQEHDSLKAIAEDHFGG